MTTWMPGWVRTARPSIGVLLVVVSVIAYALIWLIARPADQPFGRYVGELAGVESILLLSWSLVLATTLPFLEPAFEGLDREIVWHRLTAIVGVLLFAPHVLLAVSPPSPDATTLGNGLGTLGLVGLVLLTLWSMAPGLRVARLLGPLRWLARVPYERWLVVHRLTGLFVIASVVHGAMVDPVLHRSPLLNAVAWAVGGVGIAAYLYRELLARFFWHRRDYRVAWVERLSGTTMEIGLEPVADPIRFAPGQFVFALIGGPGKWQVHPFTISSAPSEPVLRLSVQVTGDYTRTLYDALQAGVPAKISQPQGWFDYRHGGRQQIWIAAGIGITPFISWVRALDGDFDRDVDFFYAASSEHDAIYLDEIKTTVARHPSLRFHLVASDHDGRLTAEQVARSTGAPLDLCWVYMCGPRSMMSSFERSFRRLGVPTDQIRWERFDIR